MTPVIAIAMPIMDWVHSATNRSLCRLRGPKPFALLDKADAPVDRARNQLVDLKWITQVAPNFTHVLFVDDDMAFDPDALERLLAHDAPIVGGLCHNRRPPYMPILMRYVAKDDPSSGYAFMYDYPEGLVEVDATGAAFLLIKREVLEKIAETGEEPFAICGCGEDVSFCLRATKLGYKILVDTTVEIEHMTTVGVNSAFARRNRDFYVLPWIDPAFAEGYKERVKEIDARLPDPTSEGERIRGDEPTPEARRARERYCWAGREIARRVRVGAVLDYGCGTGYGCPILTREALIRGSNVSATGYDVDRSATRYGRERFWPDLTSDASVFALFSGGAVVTFGVLHHYTNAIEGEVLSLLNLAPLVIGSVPAEALPPGGFLFPGSLSVELYQQDVGGRIDAVGVPPVRAITDHLFIVSRVP